MAHWLPERVSHVGQRPHAHLYTRLMPAAGKGIGVFAIRRIPAGTNPFVGDRGDTTSVPTASLDDIDDPEIRRMYTDFCPVVDDCFIAPIDFNQITQSWYLNHSDDPNIVCDGEMTFRTTTIIDPGQELTVDYRTFSQHAARLVDTGFR